MTGARGVGVIDGSWTVNALLVARPEAIEVLNRFGIDACCGGSDTLADAAPRAGVEVGVLLHELQRALEPA